MIQCFKTLILFRYDAKLKLTLSRSSTNLEKMNKTSVDKGLGWSGRVGLRGIERLMVSHQGAVKVFPNKVLNSVCYVTRSSQTQPHIRMFLNTFLFGRN